MSHVIILHTNDIHGRVEGLARVATLVARIRAERPDTPILYLDAGDIEETTSRLSNLTKGVAMHRLLSLAGCDAATIGNGGPLRYGAEIIAEYGATARYPLLLANLRTQDGAPLLGTHLRVTLPAAELRLGVIGVTTDMNGDYERWYHLKALEVAPLVRELAAAAEQDGAHAVIVLSHLGLPGDRTLAEEVQEIVPLMIGAHTHNLLPEGERVGDVTLAQAGQYAEHLGRVDLEWDGERLTVSGVSVIRVGDDIPMAQVVLDEAQVIEREVTTYLDGVVGELAAPLDFSEERECGVGDLAADMLRARMDADLGIVGGTQALAGPLPAGPVHRMTLWDVCGSSANPGVVTMSGEHLLAVVRRGLDPAFMAGKPRSLRGLARGPLHLSGAEVRDGVLLVGGQPVDPARDYRVAGTDWELEPYGGYVEADWDLRVQYDMPVIVREAMEDYLSNAGPVTVALGRIDGALAGG
jgi:2',3'-cyclic-nucleotide 2'-phosphodiesterase (5'-nucleotidase family)